MDITEVRIRLMKRDEGKLKGVASVTIDNCFVVHDVKVIEGTDDYFIAMPSKKTPEGEYKDIVHPLNSDTRNRLKDAVLAEFRKARLRPMPPPNRSERPNSRFPAFGFLRRPGAQCDTALLFSVRKFPYPRGFPGETPVSAAPKAADTLPPRQTLQGCARIPFFYRRSAYGDAYRYRTPIRAR